MAKYVIYRMDSTALDPRNSGDTHSWFFHYKWQAGDVWVPAQPDSRYVNGVEQAIQPGDWLIFCMDRHVLGATRIKDVQPNLQGELELWYDSDAIRYHEYDVTRIGDDTGGIYDDNDLMGAGCLLWPDLVGHQSSTEREPGWLKNFRTAKPT